MAEYSQRPGTVGDPETRGNDGGDGANQTREKAQQYGDQAREKAQQYGDQAREKAREYGDQAQQRADQGKDQAASGMERGADMLREKAGAGGMAGEAGTKAADAMENAAGYLRSRDSTEMMTDVESYAKAHPGQALAGAIFAGFILGRIIR